jgi:hypothetical protein
VSGRPNDARLAQVLVQATAMLDDQRDGIEYMAAHVLEGVRAAQAAAERMCAPGSGKAEAQGFLDAFIELQHRWAALATTSTAIANQMAQGARAGLAQAQGAAGTQPRVDETPEQLRARRERMN